MYSRIKSSRRRGCGQSRRVYSEYSRSPQRESVDCEPVSKRLRDRTKFSYVQRSSRSRGMGISNKDFRLQIHLSWALGFIFFIFFR